MSSNTKTALDESGDPTVPKPKLTPEEAVAMLREIRERLPLPDGTQLPVSGRRRAAQVDPAFAAAAVNASSVVDVVQTAVGYTDAGMRDEMDAATRWTQFTDETRGLLAVAMNADTVRRQRIGLAALQTYHICVQLARDERNADRLAPHLAEMKRINMFRRGRRKANAQPQAPAPAPAPTHTPAPSPTPSPTQPPTQPPAHQ